MTKDVLEWLEHGVDIKIHETFIRDLIWALSMRGRNLRPGSSKTTIRVNSFRSLLRTQFYNALKREQSVSAGRVGEVRPPHLDLPMTIELQKPRLCFDARFLNLWMIDTPFSLERLVGVPRFVYSNSHE